MGTSLKVGLAQTDSRLGQVEANLERHLELVDRARGDGVELLVFPELSLTGYRLLHLTGRVAQPIDSPAVRRLADAVAEAGDPSLIFGMVEEDARGVLYNSAVLIQRGEVRHVHRKLYLPTYGIFQEGRFFGRGDALELADTEPRGLGLLICEDLWHPHLARSLAVAGARVLVVTSAGPGRIGSGPTPDSHADWESLTRSTALVNTCWVVYCNRVGWEEGSFYPGGSHVVRPGGEVLARAPYLDEDLLVADLDLREVDRLRWRLPLVQDVRRDIRGAP